MSFNGCKSYLGCDVWQVQMNQAAFFSLCKNKNLEFYHVQGNREITFHASVLSRYKVLNTFESCQYIRSYGISTLIFRAFSIKRIIMLLLCVILFYQFPNFIFKINYHGDDKGKQIITAKLKAQYGTVPYYKINPLDVEKLCHSDFAWIDVQQKGSVLNINYRSSMEKQNHLPTGKRLIAKKAGIISHFDVEGGVKQVNINEIVNAGDVLVEANIEDTSHKQHHIDVSGKVFAKTWQDVYVSKPSKHQPNAMDLFILLLHARNKLYEDFGLDDQILKENILQFTYNNGKIDLHVHYELLQNIAILQE